MLDLLLAGGAGYLFGQRAEREKALATEQEKLNAIASAESAVRIARAALDELPERILQATIRGESSEVKRLQSQERELKNEIDRRCRALKAIRLTLTMAEPLAPALPVE